MTGIVFDTLILCTVTGLAICASGVLDSSTGPEVNGAALTILAFSTVLGRTGGAFCLVHRAERLADVICLLRENGFEAKRLRTVAHRPGKEPSLVLIEARRGAGSGLKIMPPLHICGDDGRESAEIKRIYHRED